MKFRLKPMVVSLSLAGLLSSSAFAANTGTTTQDVNAAIAKLEAQNQALQQQLGREQDQINKMMVASVNNHPRHHASAAPTKAGEKPAKRNFHGSAVKIGPFIGDSPRFNGSELIVNDHSVYEDKQLLQMRQMEESAMKKKGMKMDPAPRMLISGKVEGQALVNWPSQGKSTSDIDLTGVELDSFVEVSPMVSAFISLDYDNSINGAFGANRRISNSHVFVNKAFGIIGNLNKSPIFASFGQLYVPFGRFASGLVSAPVTQLLGRVKARAVTINYQHQGKTGPFASLYVYRSYMKGSNVNNGGGAIGYDFAKGAWSGDLAVGLISNIADAEGQQQTGGPVFGGFDTIPGFSYGKRVSAADVNGHITNGKFTFIGEYLSSLAKYAPGEVQFNGGGARPSALHIEGDYNFSLFNKPSSIAIGYGHTWQSLAFGLPENRISAALNVSLWKDTVESLEFRHDMGYPTKDTTTIPQNTGAKTFPGSGVSDNTLTFQTDVYF